MGYYIVSYDLNKEANSADYVALWAALDNLDGVKTQRSMYYIYSASSQLHVFNALKPLVDENDYLAVVEFYARPSWNKGLKGTTAWLDRHFG